MMYLNMLLELNHNLVRDSDTCSAAKNSFFEATPEVHRATRMAHVLQRVHLNRHIQMIDSNLRQGWVTHAHEAPVSDGKQQTIKWDRVPHYQRHS